MGPHPSQPRLGVGQPHYPHHAPSSRPSVPSFPLRGHCHPLAGPPGGFPLKCQQQDTGPVRGRPGDSGLRSCGHDPPTGLLRTWWKGSSHGHEWALTSPGRTGLFQSRSPRQALCLDATALPGGAARWEHVSPILWPCGWYWASLPCARVGHVRTTARAPLKLAHGSWGPRGSSADCRFGSSPCLPGRRPHG